MTAAPGHTLELITVGRISVDLYANEAGAGFIDPQTFTKSIGGTATNVAIAAARLGHRAAVFTKVGNDPFGQYVRHKLELFGVDTRYVSTHPEMPTPLAFAAMDPPEDPPLLMYRYPMGPDQTLQASEIDRQAVLDVPILWLTGAWFSKAPARDACWELLVDPRTQAAHRVRSRLQGQLLVESRGSKCRHRPGARPRDRRGRQSHRVRRWPSAPATRPRRRGGCSTVASSWPSSRWVARA
jgi:hypothetical protein